MKHQRRNAVIAALLISALLITLAPVSALAAKSYSLWVGGVEVTNMKIKGDGWSYNTSTNTLTLKDYTYTGPGRKQKYNNGMMDYAGICYDGSETLKIVLNGENSIAIEDAKDEQSEIDVILCRGNLEISGEGSLTLTAGAAKDFSIGIWCGKKITFKGGTVYAAAGAAQKASYAISAYGAINVDGGNVIGISSESDDWSCGIWNDEGISLKAGTLNATAGKAKNVSYGIYVNKGDVAVSGGTLNTESSVSGDWSCGIWCGGGISLKDGTLTAVSGKAKTSLGIYSNTKDITIDGGSLTAQAGEAEFSAGVYSNEGITINGGEITAKGGDALTGKGGSVGIQGCKSLTINDGTVTALAGKACHESYGMNSVVINGGNITSMGGEIVGTSPEPEAWDYGSFGVDSTMTLNGGTVHISGHTRAVMHSVTTSLRGTGYTDAAGTEGQTAISAGDQEQKLEFLNIQFPVNMSFGK